MCGIAGLVAKRALTAERFDEFVRSSGLMRHRGPDNQSVIRLDNILLIHQRLSIIDLDARARRKFAGQDHLPDLVPRQRRQGSE